MSDNELADLLTRNGWTLRRTNNHNVWACPCGNHMATLSKSASDHRAIKNKLCELRKLECPSLVKDLPPPTRTAVIGERRRKKSKPKPMLRVERPTAPRRRNRPFDVSIGGNLEMSMLLESVKERCERRGQIRDAG
jgi:hypothetical protein